MTDDMTNLGALWRNPRRRFAARDGLAAQRLMELEVGERNGAGYGGKTPERLAQRNGYRDRDWETRAGPVELADAEPALAFLSARDGREDAHRGVQGAYVHASRWPK